jgi:hypothetical protein
MQPQDVQAKIDELEGQIKSITSSNENLKTKVYKMEETLSKHGHDGYDTKRISQLDILPQVRALGSITMATDGQTYKLGLITTPTAITFYGAAIHYSGDAWESGSVDYRSHIVGNAQLGKGFNFQPSTTNSVITGGLMQDFIQCSSSITMPSAGGAVLTTVSEDHLVSVNYPTNTVIVARATVIKFGVSSVEVRTTLAAGWGIVGNFIVT